MRSLRIPRIYSWGVSRTDKKIERREVGDLPTITGEGMMAIKIPFIRRCPYCDSIWVCWNWCHWDLKRLAELNPQLTEDEVKKSQWGHECWNCSGVNETANKVRNGIPYRMLVLLGGKFTSQRGGYDG